MNKYALSSLFLFMCIALHAQVIPKEFIDGYIVDQESNIITGKIAVVGPEIRCQKVYFKKSNNAEVEVFTAEQLKNYSSSQGKYMSGKVVLMGTTEPQAMFFKQLTKGDVLLLRLDYKLQDSALPLLYQYEKVFFFIKEQKREIQFLDREIYVSQLKRYLGNCPEVKKLRGDYDYTDRGLTLLLKEYNEACGQKKIQFFEKDLKREKRKFFYSIEVSRSQENITFEYDKISAFNFENIVGTSIGVSLSYPVSPQLQFSGKLRYLQRGAATASIEEVVSEFYANEGDVLTINGKFIGRNILVSLGMKFIPFEQKWSPYILGNVSFGRGINYTLDLDRPSSILGQANPVRTVVTETIDDFYHSYPNTQEILTELGVGLSFKAKSGVLLYLELRLSQATVNEALTFLNFKAKGFALVTGFSF